MVRVGEVETRTRQGRSWNSDSSRTHPTSHCQDFPRPFGTPRNKATGACTRNGPSSSRHYPRSMIRGSNFYPCSLVSLHTRPPLPPRKTRTPPGRVGVYRGEVGSSPRPGVGLPEESRVPRAAPQDPLRLVGETLLPPTRKDPVAHPRHLVTPSPSGPEGTPTPPLWGRGMSTTRCTCTWSTYGGTEGTGNPTTSHTGTRRVGTRSTSSRSTGTYPTTTWMSTFGDPDPRSTSLVPTSDLQGDSGEERYPTWSSTFGSGTGTTVGTTSPGRDTLRSTHS